MLQRDSREARKIAPSLIRWAQEALPEDRSVILRTLPTTDADTAVRSLHAAGAEVESAGRGVIVVFLSPAVLEQIVGEPWILAVDEPQQLSLI